jgi:hypothetical protein
MDLPLDPFDDVEPQSAPSDILFNANLAQDLEQQELNDLASDLIEDIQNDKQARSDWENPINTMFKYLGYKPEEGRQEPFIKACAAFDSSLSKALITAYSVFRAELFPAKGPCSAEIVGVKNKEKEDRAERVELFMNNYLTKEDKGYYPDSEQLILYTIFCGSAFRKVYLDPILNKPLARMIKPQDFIINPDTVDLMSATRMTHLLQYTRKEVIGFEKTGRYVEGTLPPQGSNGGANLEDTTSSITKTIERMDGLNKDGVEEKSVFSYYECHVDLDASKVERGVFAPSEDEESYRPYIVTICADTRKIASIQRGWVEGSPDFQRQVYFANYYYIKGFGIYGLGLAHLMGCNSIVLTSVLRQLIDAGSLKNFPAFLVAKGSRVEDNNLMLGPGEGKEIDTIGMPIQQVIMPLPYGEPSAALMQLRNELLEQTAGVGAASQGEVPEAGINAPVGTTLALLEVNNRVMATVLRSFHFSLGMEFELLYKLFGESLPEQPYHFAVPGKEVAVMKADFNDFINITPVSDPNMLMRHQRLLHAEAEMRVAQSFPDLHNMREVLLRVYSAMGVENVDQIMPPPEKPMPFDAISENMNMLAGKAAVASINQDHKSHKLLHSAAAQQAMQLQNIPAYIAIMAHQQEHTAFETILESPELQQMLPQLPPELHENPKMLLTIPQIQFAVDQKNAQEEQQKQQQAAEQAAQQPQPIDPALVMLEEVKQKDRAASLHFEETKLKIESDVHKTNTTAQIEREKMMNQRSIEELKQGALMDREDLKLMQKDMSEHRKLEHEQAEKIFNHIEGANP